MSDQAKLNIVALSFLSAATIFIVVEWAMFRILRRAWSGSGSEIVPPRAPGRAAARGLLLAVSLLAFPATFASLAASFAAPWQVLWPSALLFLGAGVGGLLGTASASTKPGHRVAAVVIAAVAALVLTIAACSIFLIRLR